MSAIASAGSSSGSLYLQQLQRQQQQSDQDQDGGPFSIGNAQGSGLTAQAGGVQSGFARFQAQFESAAKSLGIDPTKVSDIEKQIQDAVQNVKQNGSSSVDQRSAIKDAVNGVLQNNGIDPAQFESALKAQGASSTQASGTHRHHGHRRSQQNTDALQSIAPTQVQPGQTTGTLVDVAA